MVSSDWGGDAHVQQGHSRVASALSTLALKTAIARQLGVSLRAIHYWIDTGQLDREMDPVTPRRPARRAQQLDPFTPLIDERLKTYPALSAVRLFDECRAAGYPGGITQLRDYVMKIRPRPVRSIVRALRRRRDSKRR